MKLKNIFFLIVTIVNFIVADNLHLRPKYLTDEEIEQQLQAQAAEAARIAQIYSNIINFVEVLPFTRANINLIQPYLQDGLLWNMWIPISNFTNPGIVLDMVNVVHCAVTSGKIESLKYICQQLDRIHKLSYLDMPTQIQNKKPTALCMQFETWNCLTILIGYGVDPKKIIIPENIATNPEKLKMCKEAIEQGLILYKKHLADKKIKAKKSEQKARNKIKKLEAQAFEALENFAYGIDSDSDFD